MKAWAATNPELRLYFTTVMARGDRVVNISLSRLMKVISCPRDLFSVHNTTESIIQFGPSLLEAVHC